MVDECTDSEGMTPTCICGLLFLLLLLLFVECSVIIHLSVWWSPFDLEWSFSIFTCSLRAERRMKSRPICPSNRAQD